MSKHLNNIASKEYSRKLQKSARIDQEKKHEFYWNINVQKIRGKKNDAVTNNKTPDNFKYTWPAGTCIRVGDSIQTGVDEKQLSKHNQVIKIRDLRGAIIDDLKHHLFSLLKKNLNT